MVVVVVAWLWSVVAIHFRRILVVPFLDWQRTIDHDTGQSCIDIPLDTWGPILIRHVESTMLGHFHRYYYYYYYQMVVVRTIQWNDVKWVCDSIIKIVWVTTPSSDSPSHRLIWSHPHWIDSYHHHHWCHFDWHWYVRCAGSSSLSSTPRYWYWWTT